MTGKPNKKGAGRPVGSVSQRTKALREISDKAIEAGITPLEVMLENMRFYYEKADVLQTALVAVVQNANKKKIDPMELLTMLKELGIYRDKAQSCAVDAAPYCHPKLSNTQVDLNAKFTVQEAEQAFKTIEHALDGIVSGEIIPRREKAKAAA